MICFYHSSDLDGHCSGAIVKRRFPDCEMIGINYGDPFPWDKVIGKNVIMVDFSLQPFAEMMKLSDLSSLTWIDHHKSAIEEFEKSRLIVTNRLDTTKAACEIAWEYFYPATEMPTFVHLLGRYDVWDHDDPRCMPFQWGVRQYKNTLPDNQDFWNSLYDFEMVNRIGEDGSIILKYRDSENVKYLKAFGFETEFEGYKAIAINKGMTNSQMFDSTKEEYDLFITFVWKKGQWTVSLYSITGVDVSVIAKKFGGGGHKGASGFQTKLLPFLK